MANILLVGKDLPESTNLVRGLELQGHTIFSSANPESEINIESPNIFSYSWKRASTISAKTLLIQAETKLSTIDYVIIVFDAQHYGSRFDADRLEDCTPAIEEMVSGYMYFCQTLLNRLAQKQNKTVVSFYLKAASGRRESSLQKTPGVNPVTNSVAIAQNAFIALAENYAVSFYQLPHVYTFLASSDSSNELFNNEKETGIWFSNYYVALEDLKNRPDMKHSVSWIKTGSKMPSSFPFFR